MRARLQAWWCRCSQRNEPHDMYCIRCGSSRIERHAQIHKSDRAVIYVNPVTGERRIPARADQPMPREYEFQGYERQEIMNMTAFERQTGLVHEDTSFNSGNEPVPDTVKDHKPSKEVREALIDDMREACASGEWTTTLGKT